LALREGPYGRCVYLGENDVVDHQVVMMNFNQGPLVTLTMHGHSHIECRTTLIEGSRGRLTAIFGSGGSRIEIDEHRSDKHTVYNTSAEAGANHGGGDFRLVNSFVNSLHHADFESVLQSTREALQSHVLAFAAEESRHLGKVIAQDSWE
jgi:hypothetical protein